MRPLLQHASRSSFFNPSAAPAAFSARAASRQLALETSRQRSICLRCQFRTSFVAFPRHNGARESDRQAPSQYFKRSFSSSRPLTEEKKPPVFPEPKQEPEPEPERHQVAVELPTSEPQPTPKKEDAVDNIARVPAEDLPSHREGQRWDFSKRINELMDDLLPKLAVVTQKVNTYTGTDYSGIAALKNEIKEQEKLVKARRAAIGTAKQKLDEAHSQQGSSQKEVVALLERKHSWSATDLERYMSLIRSEHLNDQAVREAKEAVSSAENALEEARSHLEKRERAQYHEEQIWSDTIRRNSTWVTFGLMGVNIFLLLASLVIFEPWRRRRMVREIKAALEAQKEAIQPTSVAAVPSQATEAIEAEIDKVVEPVNAKVDDVQPSQQAAEPETRVHEEDTTQEPSLAHAEELIVGDKAVTSLAHTEDLVVGDNAVDAAPPGAAPLTPTTVDPQDEIDIPEEVESSPISRLGTFQEKVSYVAHDIISERVISMRRIDFTTAVVQSAAAGAVIAAAAIVMIIRPN